jgi:hypothetical protein
MITGEIESAILLLQTTDHGASFQRAYNQYGQFGGIDVGADLASPFALVSNHLQAI